MTRKTEDVCRRMPQEGGDEEKRENGGGGVYRAVTEFCLVRKLIDEKNRSKRTGKSREIWRNGKNIRKPSMNSCTVSGTLSRYGFDGKNADRAKA